MGALATVSTTFVNNCLPYADHIITMNHIRLEQTDCSPKTLQPSGVLSISDRTDMFV